MINLSKNKISFMKKEQKNHLKKKVKPHFVQEFRILHV